MVEGGRDSQKTDVWSDWLLHRRHADDAVYAGVIGEVMERVADRVLDEARLTAGATLIDVGAGEGLLAFRALARVGPSLRVALTDISAPLLRHAEAAAQRLGVSSQCTFHECGGKARCFGRCFGGRRRHSRGARLRFRQERRAARILSRAQARRPHFPCRTDPPRRRLYARALRQRVEAQASKPTDRFLPLLHRWKAAQFPDTEEACAKSPIANYSERDLLYLLRGCGFAEIHLQLHIDEMPSLITSWNVFLGSSPHPLAPTLERILAEQFTAQERQFFEQIVRPTVESGRSVSIERVAYLQARKPLG